MKYSHRNGETEAPTESGWYWVQAVAKFPYPVWPGLDMHYVEMYGEDDDTEPDAWRVDAICNEALASLENKLRWWGPVAPPWTPTLPNVAAADTDLRERIERIERLLDAGSV